LNSPWKPCVATHCRWTSLLPGSRATTSGWLARGYATSGAQDYFNTRQVSIYTGSNEIQWDIMAKMVLGL
jgi:alkylation response protein AidB-like acyl-CoA dehydrogenase